MEQMEQLTEILGDAMREYDFMVKKTVEYEEKACKAKEKTKHLISLIRKLGGEIKTSDIKEKNKWGL